MREQSAYKKYKTLAYTVFSYNVHIYSMTFIPHFIDIYIHTHIYRCVCMYVFFYLKFL